MFRRWLQDYRRWALLCVATAPIIATGGCPLDQWLVPAAVGLAGLWGLRLLSGGA